MRPLLVDEVDGLVLDVLAQDSEVVAAIKLVLLHCRAILARMGCGGDLVVGVVPAGLGSYFLVLTPDLRPGLSYVAPAGAGVGWGGLRLLHWTGVASLRGQPGWLSPHERGASDSCGL